ncbi:MAG: hypothetical protein E7300_09755 [Lachnospiraceae bacterium]|nr:hypothetical protein [Lachnospiraceae bacterium]
MELILSFAIHVSAFTIACRPKRRMLQKAFEILYCVAVSFLPVWFVSIIFSSFCGNKNFAEVFFWLYSLIVVSLIFLTVTHLGTETCVEECVLKSMLYIDEYRKANSRRKRQLGMICFEIILFVLLYVILSALIVRLFQALSLDNSLFSTILSGFWAYSLYLLGCSRPETRMRRKTLLGIGFSLVWFILVCDRIMAYQTSKDALGLEDMLLLLFSVVFTLPTIHGWIKRIPVLLISPYTEIVEERTKDLIGHYVEIKGKLKRFGACTLNGMEEIKIAIKHRWNGGQRKELIVALLLLTTATFFFAFMIYSLSVIERWAFAQIESWYIGLDGTLKHHIESLVGLLFWMAMFILMTRIIVTNVRAEKSKKEKLKGIVVCIVVELFLGYGAITAFLQLIG